MEAQLKRTDDGLRLVVGAAAVALLLASFIWYLILRGTHALLANGVCTDTGGCTPGDPTRALLHDLAAGLGMIGMLLAVGFGLNFATTGTRLTGFAYSLGLMLIGVILWLATLLG